MTTAPPSTGVLTIDLGAIVHNWRLLKSQIQSVDLHNVCAAVLKADAYGLGLAPVAQSLWRAGCNVYFVATLAEGIELREVLPDSRCEIIVLGGLAHGSDSYDSSLDWVHYSLTPVLYCVEHIRRWDDFCARLAQRLACAIKVDTGMGRLGLSLEEMDGGLLHQTLSHSRLVYVMSHLACADNPSHPLNALQLKCFLQCVERLKLLFPDIIASLANSSGIFLAADFHFDMARPGCALYGVNPTPSTINPMSSVVSLRLPVMQVKYLSKGDSVGYGADYIVSCDETPVGIVFGGYADGLMRYLGGRGSVYFERHRLPIIGRISMDSFAIDLSTLSAKELGKLSDIEVLGEHQGVDDLAAAAATIGYEILTNLGSRYQRQYIDAELRHDDSILSSLL